GSRPRALLPSRIPAAPKAAAPRRCAAGCCAASTAPGAPRFRRACSRSATRRLWRRRTVSGALAACREYAQSHNITVLKVFIERGESAKFADRTQLLELLDFCRHNKGRVQILLVWKVDRFARNVGDHFNIKASLMKYDVRILSVTEPIDSNPEGKLMETI